LRRSRVKDHAISPPGGFTPVHVSTPTGICEKLNRKGLHAKARAGIIDDFTGVSDPDEIPHDAGPTIGITDLFPEEPQSSFFSIFKDRDILQAVDLDFFSPFLYNTSAL
jgi:adenylylsulfate kinase-like enzyme